MNSGNCANRRLRFLSGATVRNRKRRPSHSCDKRLKTRVTQALAAHVGPALDMDGTKLEVLDIADGVARIRLNGVCGNCPSSIMLVVNGIEDELRKHVPEIAYVEAVP